MSLKKILADARASDTYKQECAELEKAMSDTPRTEQLLATIEGEKKDIWEALRILTDWGRCLERECASQEVRLPESATPAAVVIVDAAGNPSVVLDSQFRAALTTGEHVLFARAYMNDSLPTEKT